MIHEATGSPSPECHPGMCSAANEPRVANIHVLGYKQAGGHQCPSMRSTKKPWGCPASNVSSPGLPSEPICAGP